MYAQPMMVETGPDYAGQTGVDDGVMEIYQTRRVKSLWYSKTHQPWPRLNVTAETMRTGRRVPS